MHFLLFIPYYAKWHYGRGITELVFNLKNLVIFVFNFFSIPVLLRTLVSPWERMGESYKKGFDLESWAETFVLNSIMRFVGLLIRTITIFLGLILSSISFLLAILVFLSWILMPFLLLFFLGIGIAKLL